MAMIRSMAKEIASQRPFLDECHSELGPVETVMLLDSRFHQQPNIIACANGLWTRRQADSTSSLRRYPQLGQTSSFKGYQDGQAPSRI